MSESEPRLIRGYLQVLASQLPASIVDELARADSRPQPETPTSYQ